MADSEFTPVSKATNAGDMKISQLPEQTSAPGDPAAAWLPVVIGGVTKRISLQTILTAAK